MRAKEVFYSARRLGNKAVVKGEINQQMCRDMKGRLNNQRYNGTRSQDSIGGKSTQVTDTRVSIERRKAPVNLEETW